MVINQKHRHKREKLLSKKMFYIIALFILVCSVTWGLFLIKNAKQNVIDSSISEEEALIDRVSASVDTSTEVCSLATQIVTHSTNLMEYFKKLKKDEDLTLVNKKDFYTNEISILEDLTNSNPYLYQIRIYVNNEKITEMMPNIYRLSRLNQLSWASEGYANGEWKIDYDDSIFPEHAVENTKHIAAKITPVYEAENEKLCVVEAATNMESIFPELYSKYDDRWSAYIDKNENVHCVTEGPIYNNKREILDACCNNNKKAFYEKINGKDYIISSIKVDEFGGKYIHVTSMEKTLSSFRKTSSRYTIYVLISCFVFFIIGVFVVKYIMRRFYRLYGAIYRVQQGEENVVIPEEGDDELTELAYQINVMLNNTKLLHEDNLKKQEMTKNAEIKALQNQINAHFMYNALESIKMMAEIEDKLEISDAITSLGRMLRYSMKWVTGTVTLAEEIEYLKNYIALMNISYDYEIRLSINISDKIMKVKIPKMILQPLVENAVYHGIEDMATDNIIYIKGKVVDESECVIEVSDCGKGMNEDKLNYLRKKLKDNSIEDVSESDHGIGLKNVQDRIKMCFGQKYKMEIFSEEGKYTKIAIRLPMNKEMVTKKEE